MIAPTPKNKKSILLVYVALDTFIVAAFVWFYLQGKSLSTLLPVFAFLFLLNAVAMVLLLKTPTDQP